MIFYFPEKDAIAREHKFSEISPSLTEVEAKFFEELVKCKELQNQIQKQSLSKTTTVKTILKDPTLLRNIGVTVKNNDTTTIMVKKSKGKPTPYDITNFI